MEKKYTLSFMNVKNSENSNWDKNKHKGRKSRFGSPNIIYFPEVNI